MKPYTIALTGLSLSLVLASWTSRKNGDQRRDRIAMMVFAGLAVIGTLVSI